MQASKQSEGGQSETPLNEFSNCHAGIMKHLADFGDLPMLLAPAERARRIAADVLGFFRAAVFTHHEEEEAEWFPAVLASARAGEERDRVQAITQRLTQEHRAVEALWKQLEPDLKLVAKGQASQLDVDAVARLVETYAAHARYEETELLPLSREILERDANHMAALGLSLHIRHLPRVAAYV